VTCCCATPCGPTSIDRAAFAERVVVGGMELDAEQSRSGCLRSSPIGDRLFIPRDASPPPLMTLLVVDDDAVGRVMLRRCLSNAGLATIIDELPDGHDVVTRACGFQYDCIVLDHSLPGETSFEVIARLRAAGIATPILCVASQDEATGRALIAAGATDFVPKRALSAQLLSERLLAILRGERVQKSETISDALTIVSTRSASGTKPAA
jgi:CheY-like chemotaxis protein